MDSLSTSGQFLDTLSRGDVIGIISILLGIAGIFIPILLNKRRKKKINNIKPEPSGDPQIKLYNFIKNEGGKCSHKKILEHSNRNPHATNRSLIKMTARKILIQSYEKGETFYELP